MASIVVRLRVKKRRVVAKVAVPGEVSKARFYRDLFSFFCRTHHLGDHKVTHIRRLKGNQIFGAEAEV
jgi:hypothetical protein